MKFMVEFHFHPGTKSRVADLFELRGPNRHPGVKFLGAWIGSQSDLAFVLVEGDDASRVAEAARAWHELGKHQIYPVTDVEQF